MVEPRSAVREILARCLEEIESGAASAEACLAEYPAYATELRPLLMAAGMLQEASDTRPSLAFRREARSRLLAHIQPQTPAKASLLGALRAKLSPASAAPQSRRLSLAWILLLALLIIVSLNAGTVYASDAAVPGQPLYRLDRTLERLRAGITRDPEAVVAMQLGFAEERLSEARELVGAQDRAHFKEALTGYGESIDTVAETAASAAGASGEGLGGLLDEALSSHDTLLAALVVTDGVEGSEAEGANRFCDGGETHPVAQSMAEQYGADAGQIMGWFCGSGDTPGIGFGQIMLALRRQSQLGSAGPSTEELLERRMNGEGWGQIWKDLGVTGKPAGAGPPEHAGPKDKAEGSEKGGPPEHAGPKDKAEGSEKGGPPDHAGRPDGVGLENKD